MISPERRQPRTMGRQFTALVPLLLVWTIASVLLYASAAQDEVPTERLFLDAATLGDQPWYTGLLHELGILGWTVAATAAIAGAWVAQLANRRAAVAFLASSSLLTLGLLGDDITGFHSDLGPRIGFPKLLIIASILGASAVWFIANWKEIRRTRWLTLAASLGALALSVALDYERRDATSTLHIFFEDAPKLLGILGWATYFVFTATDITRSMLRPPDDAALV